MSTSALQNIVSIWKNTAKMHGGRGINTEIKADDGK